MIIEFNYKSILERYKNKRVFITGNTGFKGSWLTYILLRAGAKVIGYALRPHTESNLFGIVELEHDGNIVQYYEDIRDFNALKTAYASAKPEIVIHLAAQPIVRESYRDPVNTYTTNVNGTLNILECIRTIPGCGSFLNVTTDKVYKNFEWEYGYREDDPLDGFDPYSNSKSCSELLTHTYNNSFFSDNSVAVSTARAGNVIGGGDFSAERIIPDCVRTVMGAVHRNDIKGTIGVRNPHSIRPYQHVLESLFAYLMIAIYQCEDRAFAGYYNVGPDDCDCLCTGDLVTMFCDKWNTMKYDVLPELEWVNQSEENAPHEANFLKLDCSHIKHCFRWYPRWHINEAIDETVRWTNVWLAGDDVRAEMDREIEEYCRGR